MAVSLFTESRLTSPSLVRAWIFDRYFTNGYAVSWMAIPWIAFSPITDTKQGSIDLFSIERILQVFIEQTLYENHIVGLQVSVGQRHHPDYATCLSLSKTNTSITHKDLSVKSLQQSKALFVHRFAIWFSYNLAKRLNTLPVGWILIQLTDKSITYKSFIVKCLQQAIIISHSFTIVCVIHSLSLSYRKDGPSFGRRRDNLSSHSFRRVIQ